MKFVLMPDALSASNFRSKLAEKNTVGVKVGTFPSLLETLRQLWLLPELDDEFENAVKESVLLTANNTDTNHATKDLVFWSKSIKVDEAKALSEISASLKLLLNALLLEKSLNYLDNPKTRVDNYYNDLVKLHLSMKAIRPLEQMQAKQWFVASGDDSIEPLELIYLPSLFSFEPWQAQMIQRLKSCGEEDQPQHSGQIREWLNEFVEKSNQTVTELNRFSQSLFELPDIRETKEAQSIQWLSCRDSLQEIEVVVGMVQKALADGIELDQMALVIPHHADYLKTLPDLLNASGILTSNRQAYTSAFQWDLQLIKDLLVFYQQKKSDCSIVSPMSFAAIVTNPLMPWSRSTGQGYAERCFKGRLEQAFENETSEKESGFGKNRALLVQISKPTETWHEWLLAICENLDFPKDARFTSLNSMKSVINSLVDSYSSYEHSNDLTVSSHHLELLIKQIEPLEIEIELHESGTVVNGLLVLTENEWLLKPIKHLFVVGFNQGHYISPLNTKSIFDLGSLQSLEEQLELCLDNSARKQAQFELRMKTMFSKTEESVTFLLSEQSLLGEYIQPSETLLDMALCFQQLERVKPESLIRSVSSLVSEENNLDTIDSRLAFFKLASEITGERVSNKLRDGQQNSEPCDLTFDFDLLQLHQDRDGKQWPESPSSLEKMMISPLAWLLNRQGLEPKSWDVEELGAALKGSIAHKVFELHFDSNTELSINDYEPLYAAAIQIEAPFVQLPQWRLERVQLKHEIQKSLIPFISWCEESGWDVTETELKLVGELWGLQMKGYADSVLNKTDSSLILDYKKSKSFDRIKRLENGYDLQTTIYRELFEQQIECKKKNINSGYYTLNDNKLVLDTFTETQIDGIDQVELNVAIDQQSIEAINLIKQRIEELKNGKVKLNRVGDTEFWKDMGINASYSIDNSPLVGHFMKAAQVVEHE